MLLTYGWQSKAQNSTLLEWNVNNVGANPGERVVAIIDAGTAPDYIGASLVGQVIDGNGNWGYNLATVANFKVYVRFSYGFSVGLEQDKVTPNITLELKSISPTQVALVANCFNYHTQMRILMRQTLGSATVTLGDPTVVSTTGTVLMAQPVYHADLSGSLQIADTSPATQNSELLSLKTAYDANKSQKALTWRDASNITGQIATYFDNGETKMSFGHLYNNGYQNTDAMTLTGSGSVGIGTSTPGTALEVNGTVTTSGWLDFKSGDTRFRIVSGPGVFQIGDDDDVSLSQGTLYTSASTQRVGIGTTHPDAPLAVNGTIHAKEVKVDLNIPAPDYVFTPDYAIKGLAEVQKYIDENKHLPDVPSAAEIKQDGIKVGEFNMLLLKKVEELTLYLLQKDTENKKQQQEIDQLKKDLTSLTKLVAAK